MSWIVAAVMWVFGAFWTGAWFALVGWRRDRLWFVAGLLLWTTPLHEYADRIDALTSKQRWTTRDRLGVWLLNLGMALSGAAMRWRLSICATVEVAYPPRGALHLFEIDGRPIRIEEGLYWRLQEDGWLHPYTARWCWEE